METSKTRPRSKTEAFSSIQFISIAVCFVALIHVEIELHAHRQMLGVLTKQRGENLESRNIAHAETIDSGLKVSHSDVAKGMFFHCFA